MVQILVMLVVLGIAWYFLQAYIAEPFRKIILVIAVLFFSLWLLSVFGILNVPFSFHPMRW